jgi:ABC-2 type transport system permease protein
MVQAPVDVYLGKASGAALLELLLVQGLWGMVLLAASRLLLGMAVRRVIVQGG